MNDDDNKREIALSTGKIMFYYFLNNLINKKLATINEENSSIVNLDSFASNWFMMGRSIEGNELKNPFIGIQEGMIPWFLEISWQRILIDFEKGHIYLTCAESRDDTNFTLRLTSRVNRLNVFKSGKNSSIISALDFRIFRFESTDDITISNKVYKRCAVEEFDGLDSVVAIHEDDIQLFENNKTFRKNNDDDFNKGTVKFFDDY